MILALLCVCRLNYLSLYCHLLSLLVFWLHMAIMFYVAHSVWGLRWCNSLIAVHRDLNSGAKKGFQYKATSEEPSAATYCHKSIDRQNFSL